jgi:uncharacterized protein (DUF2236 family)
MRQHLLLVRHQAKRGIVQQVQALFNDRARGEAPVPRSNRALFAPDTMIWRVHGDVVSMMVGGVAALLLQMLHPAVLAGVWDHSNFRTDMLGRLRRTARFIAVTTYGERDAAEAAIARVRAVHAHIGGTLPDGTRYRADDPALIAWVHLSEARCFLAAWQRYGDRPLTPAQEDRYFAEFAGIGTVLGAAPLPRDRIGTDQAIRRLRPALIVDRRTREVAQLVLRQTPASPLAIPMQRFAMQAAIDLLPDWARRMHGLPASPALLRPAVRSGTLQLARTLRWAFAA